MIDRSEEILAVRFTYFNLKTKFNYDNYLLTITKNTSVGKYLIFKTILMWKIDTLINNFKVLNSNFSNEIIKKKSIF